MKKYLIYMVLSVLVMIPIACIIVISVVNQPKNQYESIHMTYDYSTMETCPVERKDLKEIKTAEGCFNSEAVSYQDFIFKTENVQCLVEEGEYITQDTPVFRVKGNNTYCEMEGILKGVYEAGSRYTLEIQENTVTEIEIALPVEDYPYVRNSKISFVFGDQEYTAELLRVGPAADTGGQVFLAYYGVEDDSFLLGAKIPVQVETGKEALGTNTISKKCIYRSEDGRYYIKILEGDSMYDIYVTLGLMNQSDVEIFGETDGEIFDGLRGIVNSENVFDGREKSGNEQEE